MPSEDWVIFETSAIKDTTITQTGRTKFCLYVEKDTGKLAVKYTSTDTSNNVTGTWSMKSVGILLKKIVLLVHMDQVQLIIIGLFLMLDLLLIKLLYM